MADHKSAKKRARQSEKRRVRNRRVRGALRSAVKNVRAALSGGAADSDPATALRAAESEIRKAASKGVVSKKQASRTVSRLAKAVHAAQS